MAMRWPITSTASTAPLWVFAQRITRSLNPGRKSANYLQGRTICVSCRCTGPCWTVPRKRENRV